MVAGGGGGLVVVAGGLVTGGAGATVVVGAPGAPSPVMAMSEHALKCSCCIGSHPKQHFPVTGSHAQPLPAV